ncbi:MAG: hypothetical protein FWC08_05065, partial [Defluviitaleaceae bacterium]|nr:hypothetical protein [Defluviitaleaceae bacterium]
MYKQLKCFALLFALCTILSACMVDEHSGAAYLGEVPTLLSTTPAALELTPEATPPNPAPSPPPRPANARDFGGRTLRIGAWWPAPI